ncbi:MAG: STAS domain-containing protein [Ignavibacteriaceae bacterium]|nr:STAS domain-containing protein [Ignavibacteriaceae bacterium]NUM69484.1 STAS domain-containing protein [Ignavibacteriaceae bacterium]
MNFTAENISGIIVVTVNLTRATLSESDEFKQLLLGHIDQKHFQFVVDLSQCEFIDSTFLGSLVVTLKKVTVLGGDLKLVGFQPAVQSMFELTRMYRIFEAFGDKQLAVNSFTK